MSSVDSSKPAGATDAGEPEAAAVAAPSAASGAVTGDAASGDATPSSDVPSTSVSQSESGETPSAGVSSAEVPSGEAPSGEAPSGEAPSGADVPAGEAPSGEASSGEAPSGEAPSGADVPSGIHVRLYGQTDVGLVREHNEDNFLVVDLSTSVRGLDDRMLRHALGPRGSMFAVCDGMGGAAAGEIASQMAVDTLHDIMLAGGVPESRDHFALRLVHAIEEAGSRIFSSAKMDRTRRGMGTTSTVAGVVDKVLFVGQIGDSRAYALRGGKDFALITKDQSLVNQLIEAGQLTEEEAEAFEHSNIILQALGTAEQVTVDLTFLELKRGDRLMLCSDGLSGLVHGEMIKDVLATVPDPRACCATLIEMARAGGGHDNITVIVIDFDGSDLAPPDEGSRVAYQQYPLPDIADPRASFPPREPGMKLGAAKPGSDVKSMRPPAARGGGSNETLARGRPWVLAVVVLLVALVVVLGYAFLRGGTAGAETSGVPEGGEPPVSAPTQADREALAPEAAPLPEAATGPDAPLPEAAPVPEAAPMSGRASAAGLNRAAGTTARAAVGGAAPSAVAPAAEPAAAEPAAAGPSVVAPAAAEPAAGAP